MKTCLESEGKVSSLSCCSTFNPTTISGPHTVDVKYHGKYLWKWFNIKHWTCLPPYTDFISNKVTSTTANKTGLLFHLVWETAWVLTQISVSERMNREWSQNSSISWLQLWEGRFHLVQSSLYSPQLCLFIWAPFRNKEWSLNAHSPYITSARGQDISPWLSPAASS